MPSSFRLVKFHPSEEREIGGKSHARGRIGRCNMLRSVQQVHVHSQQTFGHFPTKVYGRDKQFEAFWLGRRVRAYVVNFQFRSHQISISDESFSFRVCRFSLDNMYVDRYLRSVGLSLFLKIYYAHKKKGKKEKTLQKIKEKQRQFIEIATRIKYENKKFGS